MPKKSKARKTCTIALDDVTTLLEQGQILITSKDDWHTVAVIDGRKYEIVRQELGTPCGSRVQIFGEHGYKTKQLTAQEAINLLNDRINREPDPLAHRPYR
jgi:hypothetical protein